MYRPQSSKRDREPGSLVPILIAALALLALGIVVVSLYYVFSAH